jgi:hypothetical protein
MSALFAVAGLVNLFGFAEIQLGFFEYTVTSRTGNIFWIIVSSLVAFFSGRQLRKKLRGR